MANINRDYLVIADLKSGKITSPNMSFYNTDKNIANLFVKLQITMSTNPSITGFVNKEEASDYNVKLTVVKPKTTMLVELTGVVQDESVMGNGAVYLFDMPQNFTDQVGKYICELEITCMVNGREEIVTCDPFRYTVKASAVTGLNVEIEPNPDIPVLRQLIDEVRYLQENEVSAETFAAYQKITDDKLKQVEIDLNEAVANATNGSESVTNSEIVLARKGKTSLREKIDEFDSQIKDKANQKELEIEKSRIDLLTKIQNGETQGNTELLDIRIDKNGTIHDTAGNATRVAILDNNSVSPNKIAEEYIDLLQDTKIYINQSQSGYYPETGAINRINLDGYTCTDAIPISLLEDEIIIPLDNELQGQSFIFLDSNKKAYYSKNANAIKSNTDMQEYLKYDEVNKEYKLLIKKYSQNVGRVNYISFNFLSSRKYIKKLAENKSLKWLRIESENLKNESVIAKHIDNSELLSNYTDIYNKFIASYNQTDIVYSDANNQVSTTYLDLNDLSDTLSFKVISSLKGQVIVLKNNLNEYFASLNATLIINKEFRQLEGYITFNEVSQIATIDIKKLRANVGTTTIVGMVISSDAIENIKGFVYKDLKWLRIPNKTDVKEEKFEIRLLEEYALLKGVEYNFYTSQTVMCSRRLPEKYMAIWQYSGAGATVYDDGIRIKETATGTNYLTLKVFVEEDGEIVLKESKTVKIIIVENNVTNKKMLFIGDSRIEDGAKPWPARVQLVTTIKNVLDSSNMFLGTRGGGSLANHEGRSGWRSYDYCMTEYDSKREYSNEFYNSNFTDTLSGLTSHFDFSYYMSNKGYNTVDLVGIYLGANDLYDDNSIIYQKMMIKSIKSFNHNIKIILFSDYLSPCDNYSLLPAGLTYMKRRLSQMNYYAKQKQMLTDLGYSDVYIIGANNVIDDWYDFNRGSRKISYRNNDSEAKEYIVDAIHPKSSGYDKIADLASGHINYILS